VRALTVYTRVGCELCEEFLRELGPVALRHGATVLVRDVDADAASRQAFGLKVPALVLDGELVCFGTLDRDLLERRLAGQ
jgi:predicted thioredoxin/glutaredoxin